ncbi:MAG: DNA-processing protein DprA [Anaeroplasmataceae bacterium]
MRSFKIINYFILLQLFRYKRERVRIFYEMNQNLFGLKIEDLLFNVDNKNFNVSLTATIKENAILCYEKNKNNILFYEDEDFPRNLKKVAEYPLVLFYKGNKKLLNNFSFSIVGTRTPSDNAINNTNRVVKCLIENNAGIVSGLAKGIDVTAHKCCLENNYYNIIAVIGTPLDKYYPIENKKIQQQIESNGLLITEYTDFEPILKWNFLRRNYIMSAISNSTVVIEAGDTSGTVSQARSTLKNGKKIFVPASVFDNPNNCWPRKFKNEFNNVFRFEFLSDLKEYLKKEII